MANCVINGNPDRSRAGEAKHLDSYRVGRNGAAVLAFLRRHHWRKAWRVEGLQATDESCVVRGSRALIEIVHAYVSGQQDARGVAVEIGGAR